jgi:integrator complex subunit 11
MLDCGIHMVNEQKFPDFHFIYGGDSFIKKDRQNIQAGVSVGSLVNNSANLQDQIPHLNKKQKAAKKEIDFTDVIDLVLISHFHLDHCGALPYFTEAIGYSGPIVATPPTKAIIPLMLEDFRKVSVAQKGGVDAFSQEMIDKCISKI